MPRIRNQAFTNSLYFNGSNTTVNLGQPAAINNLTDFSLEGWIKPPRSATNSIFNTGYNSGTNHGIEVRFAGGSGTLQMAQGSGSVNSATGIIPFNTWTHIGISQTASSVIIYINGIVSNGTQSLTQRSQNAVNAYFGARNGTSLFFIGNICNMNLYSSGLPASDFLLRVNGLPISTAPVAKYQLQEGTGTTASDTSGGGNNGTITAGTWTTDVPSNVRSAAVQRTRISAPRAPVNVSRTAVA